MTTRRLHLASRLDWPTLFTVLALIVMGWFNIVSATADGEVIWGMEGKAGKQLVWMGVCLVMFLGLLLVEGGIFHQDFNHSLSHCHGTASRGPGCRKGGWGSEVLVWRWKYWCATERICQDSDRTHGGVVLKSRWPSLADVVNKTSGHGTDCLACHVDFDAARRRDCPCVWWICFVLYREGLSGNVLLLGVAALVLSVLTIILGASESWYPFIGMSSGFWWLLTAIIVLGLLAIVVLRAATLPRYRKIKTIWSALILLGSVMLTTGLHFGMEHVLQPHQKERIHVLFGIDVNNPDADYNIRHAQAAIGSGGWTGKGWNQGPMTAFGFVPEQETDFIFCTVGEEWGFLGSTVVVILFIALILRVLHLAERQRSHFTRIYAYAVASILFIHFLVNVGMVIGLAPVIGIPLPFFSYGGSSLLGFTLLLGILLRLDAERFYVLR